MTPDVREHGQRLEKLLDAVESAAGPQAWPRVEALLAALLELYGEGLERLVTSARAEARSANELDARLSNDEIVSSLLLLHGLHPLGLEERIDLALRRVSSAAASAAALELVGIEDGVVNLRVAPGAGELPLSASTQLAVSAIERAAPEVSGVSIEGLTKRPATDAAVVPVERLVRRGRR
jgi:hypothetical protein